MKTVMVLLVEHGEDTDAVQAMAQNLIRQPGVEDYDLQVDVQPRSYFEVENTGETVYLRRTGGWPQTRDALGNPLD